MKKLVVIKKNIRPSRISVALGVLQEQIRDPRKRFIISKILTAHRRTKTQVTKDKKIDELNQNGYSLFPQFISKSEVYQIKVALEEMLCVDPWNKAAGEFRFDSPPRGTHVAHIPLAPTLDYLHVLASRNEVVDLVTEYFGCKPILDSIQAWWSYPGNENPQEAENFHRDNECIRFLKFFIYLTDVDHYSGPHVLVEGSANTRKLVELRRYSDEEVQKEFGERRIKEIVGAAGDAFIEDTYGIHKGQLPKSRQRLLIQFRYVVTPTIFRSPIMVERSAVSDCKLKSLVAKAR